MTIELSTPMIEEKKFNNPTVDWEKVFLNEREKLFAFVFKKIKRTCESEDVVQQVYTLVMKNGHNFCGNSKPETWMFGIANNLTKKFYRDDRRMETNCDDSYIADMCDATNDCSRKVEAEIMLKRTKAAIDNLPEKMKYVLSKFAYDGYSYDEIAEDLGVPVGTVRSRLSRARAMLQEQLDS
ncbi:RNA polymerase subunit sigma [Veronia nyctiphanis]|uniref:RNA polymerase subunit sigma n=1 Tax=Veronia nyctiphanis TaxID=1278244 RepID=A0A4Q0YT15_9GAMM|nr:sigma-70 family RNA polymerase sigma factor [Veronia nyctiphanis]RXJ72259.1 RNA polymerase subunit sigma [Veronia nyctiphanis]